MRYLPFGTAALRCQANGHFQSGNAVHSFVRVIKPADANKITPFSGEHSARALCYMLVTRGRRCSA
jgi:hypothetical protein